MQLWVEAKALLLSGGHNGEQGPSLANVIKYNSQQQLTTLK